MRTKTRSIGTRLVLAFAIIALVFVHTFGIEPKENPALAQSSDVWQYVTQSVADGACFTPNTLVTTSWTLNNAGGKTWQNYVFVGGPNNISTNVAYTSAGQNVTLTASFTTPSAVGAYRADYSLKDEAGNIVSSVNGSSTMWLSYEVSANCNTNSAEAVPQNGVNNQANSAGGHWVEVAEVSHTVCKWQTIFGCWWSEKVIDVPASRTWVPDPTPIPAATQPPAPIVPIETQPPVTTYQIAPSGQCHNVGETQVGTTWTVTCIGGKWVNATIDPSGNTVVPIELPTAPAATPIPGAPTSFNGVALPSTASNVISGGGVVMYMFAGSMTLPANYILVAEGTAYTTLSAAGTSVVSTVAACAMPLAVIGVAFFIAYGIYALVTVPAAIVHPPAVPAPSAPVTLSTALTLYPQLGELYTDLAAMESVIGINVTNRPITIIALPATISDKVLTLPRGTQLSISTLTTGDLCNHKSEFHLNFPWGKEIFEGYSDACDEWGEIEAVIEMLRNFSRRVMRFWDTVKNDPSQLAVRTLVENATDDLIDLIITALLQM